MMYVLFFTYGVISPLHFCTFEKKNVVQEALFYQKKAGNKVKCLLCPWYCELDEGGIGACKVRKNSSGKLETMVYNKVAAWGMDPIEKKPLYHFYPGRQILSVGNVGCNLHCTFCQNHAISQCRADEFKRFVEITAAELLVYAKELENNIGVAYTFNEPFTFYEFMFDSAKLLHQAGLKNVVVSNGYINQEPLKTILPFIDAFNIDLKAFDDQFYRQQTLGKLEPVLKTIGTIARSNAHLELTNLVIPGLNDDETQYEEMVRWIAGETGAETPFHISRYFPKYKLDIPATPVHLLERMYNLAKKHLRYVYVGNIYAGELDDTLCPACGKVLVKRNRYRVTPEPGFSGNCPACGYKIALVL